MEIEQTVANPWTWQDDYGFVQARVIDLPARMIVCAGQAAVDSQGAPQHPGDMVAQLLAAFDNLETVLAEAGAVMADVIRLNYYVVDRADYLGAAGVLVQRLTDRGSRPASTMLEVKGLALPELLVEIEATAMVRQPRSA